MTIPELSEATIRSHSSAESYSRGQSYYEHGAVSNLALRGNLLQADVEGSQYTPYRVRVTFEQGEITSATCTCPYDWGGWCKHIVAVLVAAHEQPEKVEERKPIAEVLGDLSREQLQALLLKLIQFEPELIDMIEAQLPFLAAGP